MKTLLLPFLVTFNVLSTNPSHACYELSGEPQVSWVAFKTPQKIGVGGSYKSLKRVGKNKGDNLEDLLVGQRVTLSSKDIFTKNPARDKNIREAFFEELSKSEIQARIAKVTKKIIELEVIMNGEKVTIPMTYQMKDNNFKAEGHLDILDFGALKALKAINKRCYALHEGKTWSHVEVSLKQQLKKCQ